LTKLKLMYADRTIIIIHPIVLFLLKNVKTVLSSGSFEEKMNDSGDDEFLAPRSELLAGPRTSVSPHIYMAHYLLALFFSRRSSSRLAKKKARRKGLRVN